MPPYFCQPVYIYFCVTVLNNLYGQGSTSMNCVVCRQYHLLCDMNMGEAYFITGYRGLLLNEADIKLQVNRV